MVLTAKLGVMFYFNNVIWRLLIFIFLIFMSIKSLAEVSFTETSIGMALHSIDVSPSSGISTLGEYMGFSMGIEAKHTLSVMGSVRLWNTEDDEDDPAQHIFLHDFHFTGLSVGLDGQFFLPTLNKGPYLKIGRHCWSANVSQIFNIWNGNGCSNLAGAGLMLGGTEGEEGKIFAEVLLTRFEYINSWMLAVGMRF